MDFSPRPSEILRTSLSVAVVPYEHVHLDSILTLCGEAGAFSSFASDRDRAGRALHGPGAIALVALRDGELVGFSHALTDGAFQAFLSLILVHPSSRRQGIGRRLVGETLARCCAARLDLLSYEDAGPLYASFRTSASRTSPDFGSDRLRRARPDPGRGFVPGGQRRPVPDPLALMADPGFDRQPHPGGDFGAEDLNPLFVFGQFAFVDREPDLRERLRVGAEVDLEEAEVAELEQFPGRGIEPLLQSAAPVLRGSLKKRRRRPPSSRRSLSSPASASRAASV